MVSARTVPASCGLAKRERLYGMVNYMDGATGKGISPLTKIRRRIIFYCAILLFLIFVPIIVFYALGYNIDFGNRTILRTGGIFIKTNESGFRLFLNNELSGNASFLSRGVLTSDIKPDLYNVRIEKEGFLPWQKFIRVEAEKITEFRSVVLLPAMVPEREVLDLARRGLTIASLDALPGSSWLMLHMNERSNLTYFFNTDAESFDAVESFTEFRWDPEERRLLVRRESPRRWAVISLVSTALREERLSFPKAVRTITAADFFPGSQNEFLVQSSDGVLSHFLRNSQTVQPLAQDVYAFAASDSRIYFISGNGFFASTDREGKNAESYGRKGMFLSDSPVTISADALGDAFVIDSGGGFFVRTRNAPEIMPISGSIKGAAFTAGGDKILYWSDHDIYVAWLADEKNQPFHAAGEHEKIISFPDAFIRYAAWFGDPAEHIFFHAGTIAGVTDIDTRGGGPTTATIFQEIAGLSAFDPVSQMFFRSERSFLFRSDLQ